MSTHHLHATVRQIPSHTAERLLHTTLGHGHGHRLVRQLLSLLSQHPIQSMAHVDPVTQGYSRCILFTGGSGHLMIHTHPEDCSCTVDVFLHNSVFCPAEIVRLLQEEFQSQWVVYDQASSS